MTVTSSTSFVSPMGLERSIDEGRDIFGRVFVLATHVVATPIMMTSLSAWLVSLPFDNSLITAVGAAAGLCASVGVLIYSIPKLFIITNNTTNMFLTQDSLASLLGNEALVNVSYGPGSHVCYPWERRIAENNIELKDAPVDFQFSVMVRDALLQGSGSFRLRPDALNPIAFLQSAASIGQEVSELIVAKIQDFFATDAAKELSSTDTAILVGKVNAYLEAELVTAKADVERRNGVQVSDATVGKILPSEELQKTLSSVSEARAVEIGTAILLGMEPAEVRSALAANRLTQADVAQARRDFLSISGNLDGMKINRTEFDLNIRGLDADALNALADMAKTPAAQAALTAAARISSGGEQKKGNK